MLWGVARLNYINLIEITMFGKQNFKNLGNHNFKMTPSFSHESSTLFTY